MKKVYSKPQIVFDSFELSQSIAAGCERISNHAKNQCALDMGVGKTIFTIKGVCERTQPDGKDGICYDVPWPDNNVFSS